MKSIFTLFTILCSLLVIEVNGQSTIKYTSPETGQFAPIQLTSSVAKQEAQAASGSCGYSSAYFDKTELESLMSAKGCVGIRIYNAKVNETQHHCDVVAVAVNEDGKEIPSFGKKYLHGSSFDNNPSCPSSKVNKNNAKGYVENVANSSSLEYQKVFFSKSLINERLAVAGGTTGINVLPGDLSGEKTMMVSAAKLEGGKLTDLGDAYMKSKLPCPTDCGDTGNYLVAPK